MCMKTSEKLRKLADAVRRNRRFNIMNPRHCIVAVGLRYQPQIDSFLRTVPTPLTPAGFSEQKEAFGQKYGLPYDVVKDLWIGYDGNENMVHGFSETPQRVLAAKLLNTIADRYEAIGR